MKRSLVLVLPLLLLVAGPRAGGRSPSVKPEFRVTGLETDAAATPLGIDAAQPRFTWRIESAGPGIQQASYRLVVATVERSVADGHGAGIVWDSKAVPSPDPFGSYAGPPLASRTRYFWAVRVAIQDGPATVASTPSWFETAYMNPGEWKGVWISGPQRLERPPTAAEGTADDGCCAIGSTAPAQPATAAARPEGLLDFCRPPGGRGSSGACREVRPAPMMRRSFLVEPVTKHGRVVSARVYSSGLAYDSMTVNGKRTSDRFLGPAFTNYAKTVLYTTDEVTALVRQEQALAAENVVATELGSGQFDNETTSFDWRWESAEWRATPRLRMDLYVKYADGHEQLVASDEAWKVTTAGPTRYDGYHLGETYDARREIAGWNEPGFDASSWPPVRVVDGPLGVPRAQRVEPTRVVATWPAGTRTTPLPGVVVYDTGRQRAGWVTISVHGARAGTPIQIFYSDKTAPDGTVSSSGFTPNGQIQTDYYIARGTGTAERPERFMPRFTYKGFQYVQVSSPSNPASTSGGVPQPLPDSATVTVDSVQEVRTAMEGSGVFRASNPLLEQIEGNVRSAIAENYVAGIITDTPEYEKNGWTGDAQLTVPTASLLFDTERQYWKSFQDMADNQVAETGEVPLLAPTNKGYGFVGQTFKNAANAGATPIWDAFWFVTPWESYMRYGDLRALEITFPLMQKYLDRWVPQWTGKDGDRFDHTLTSGLGDWLPATGEDAPEGAPTRFRVPTVIAPSTTAYYAYLLKIAADSARALGRQAEAAHFDEVFGRIKADFNARWWDAQAGFYREAPKQEFAQTLQVLPLAFGLAPPERRAGLQAKLIQDVMATSGGHEMVGIAGSRWILMVLSDAADEGVAGAADAAYTIASQTTYPSYGYWAGLGWTSLGESWEQSSRTRSHHMFGAVAQWFYENLVGIKPLEPGYRRIAFRPAFPSDLEHAEASYDSVRGRIASSWRKGATTLTLDVTMPPTATGVVLLPVRDADAVSVSNRVRCSGWQGARLACEAGSGTHRFIVSRDALR